MSDTGFTVFLMLSISYALKAEKLLKKSSISSKLIPVPRQLSSDCGVCVRVAREDGEQAARVLIAGGVTLEGKHNV